MKSRPKYEQMHDVITGILFSGAFGVLIYEFTILLTEGTKVDFIVASAYWIFYIILLLACVRLLQQYLQFFRKIGSGNMQDYYIDTIHAFLGYGCVLTIIRPTLMFSFITLLYISDAYQCDYIIKKYVNQLNKKQRSQLNKWKKHDIFWYLPVTVIGMIIYLLTDLLIISAIIMLGFMIYRTIVGKHEKHINE